MENRISIRDARKQLEDLRQGYVDQLKEFNETKSLLFSHPLKLMAQYEKIRSLVLKEEKLIERMKASFPEGSAEREETRKLYEEAKKAREGGEKAVIEMRDAMQGVL